MPRYQRAGPSDHWCSAVKTICIVLSIPFLFVILGMLIGLFRWLKSDSVERQKTGE